MVLVLLIGGAASSALIAAPAIISARQRSAVQMSAISRRAVFAAVAAGSLVAPLMASAGLAEDLRSDELELFTEAKNRKSVDNAIKKGQKLELDARALIKKATKELDAATEAGESEKAADLKAQITSAQVQLDDEACPAACSNRTQSPRSRQPLTITTHAWQDTKLEGLKAEDKALAETEKKQLAKVRQEQLVERAREDKEASEADLSIM